MTLRAVPLIRRYDAEVLSQRSLDGNGFRVEAETQNVTGHRDFDVQYPDHVLTLTPDGPPTWVGGRIDGNPIDRFAVRPGQITLLPMGQRFRGHTDGRGIRSEVRLFFGPELLAQGTGVDVEPSHLQLGRSTELRNPSILQAMAALGRETQQPGMMGRVYTESLVWLVLTELVRHHSTLSAAPKPVAGLSPECIRRVTAYIEAHLSEDLSLRTLAAEAGVSPAHLARGFRRTMGRSVHQYLLGRRVDWAAALLAGTERSIVEVALATGFSSQAHLTTAFQRLYRTTPAAYRRERCR